ncbi:peptidylprolyl isomerase [Flavobacterium sp.]|uniref:peptidylprolyl isomerase n=1 Tax=Flavobacterium sp. TaxID=239 RepID=UPI003D2C10B6
MAVLSKIRQRSFFLIVIIALALFSFVLTDVIKSGGFGGGSNDVGSVNGQEIAAQGFMQKVSVAEKQGQGTSNTQAINSVWEQEVRSLLLNEEFEKLGFRIGNEQLINIIKTDPNIAQNPQFLNEAGQFDENKFKEFVKSKRNDPNPETWNQWQNYEKNVEKYAKELMYNNMIKGGMYMTKAEGKFKYEIENNKVDFDFVTLPYTNINDDEVKISDDEIMAYIKKYPKKYKSDNTVNIDYVLFENKPSKEDESSMEVSINNALYGKIAYNETTGKNDTLPGLKNTVNVGEFVNANSDIKFDSTYLAKKDLPLDYQEQLFNLNKGEVFGPYVFNGSQCLSRLIERKSNASARASHILIAYSGAPQSTSTKTKEEAQAFANDLLAQAKANPSNFAALAKANSEDPGSKDNGGEYDNITPGQMVPTFNDFVFNNSVGSIGLVETDFGFHIIKISEKYDAVLLGTIAQKIEPSETTIDQVYTQASKFEADANEKGFEATANSNKSTIVPSTNIRAYDEYIQGIGTQREIIRWAFSEENSISSIKRFDIPQGYVIATLKSKNETGLISVEMAKEVVGPILRNEKKAELIRKKMTGNTLEAVSQSSKASILNASGTSVSSPVIPNIGSEPKVVGKAFSLKSNTTSKLIDGNNGVYMIRTKNVTKAPEMPNYNSYISQERTQQTSSAQTRAYQALKDKADIKDNRAKF